MDANNGPNVPRVIEGGGGSATWGDVVTASKEAASGGATHDPVGAPPEEAPAPAGEVRATTDACDDVLGVLLAATGPLDLDTIAAEANIDATRPHLPKGVIEALLRGALAGKVTRTEEGDPTRFHYALTPAAREEIEAPGLVREARGAVVVLLAGRTTYTPATGPWAQDRLCAFDLAHAMTLANSTLTTGDPGPTVPSGMVTAFYHGLDRDKPADWMARVEQHLTGLSAAGLVAVEQAPTREGADPEPPTYALTPDVFTLYQEQGAFAVVDRTFPPKPAAPTLAELDERVAKRVADATAEAERNAALFKRQWEDSVAKLGEERLLREGYEGWFKAQKIDDPKSVIEARIAKGRGKPEDRKTFDFEQEREVSIEELYRVIAEERALKAHIETVTEEAALRKAADAAHVKTLTLTLEKLREVIGNRGRHVVTKKAYKEVRDGKLYTVSADPHDAGDVLEIEELGTNAQIVLPGTQGTGPAWTPSASSTSTPAAAQAAESPAAAPAKVEPPAPIGAIELKPKAVLPVLRALVQHPIHAAGLLGLGGVATALCGWTGMARSQAMDKVVAKVVPAMVKAGELCQGEGGLDTLFWGPAFDDPRKTGGEPTTGPAPVQAKRTRKAAPAPSADPRPEAVKKAAPKKDQAGKAPAGKGSRRAK